MKKFILSLLLAMIVSFSLVVVKADDLYYVPNKGDTYFRSQHLYSYLKDGQETKAVKTFLNTMVLSGSDPDELATKGGFQNFYTVPWETGMTVYYPVFITNVTYDAKEKPYNYRKVALEDSLISDEGKAHITGILRLTWPYISEEEAVEKLVKAGILVEKQVGDKTYYTSPLNDNPTMSVTKHEFVLAAQMAILNYTNPGVIKEVYKETVTLTYNTVVEPKVNPWSSTGTIEEVKNNVLAIYNYMLTQTDYDEAFEVVEATIKKQAGQYVVVVKTNRERNENDNIVVAVKQGENTVNNSSLSKYTRIDDKTYALTLDNLKEEDSEILYSGQEYADLKAYAFEAVDGKEEQTVVSLSSEYLPVSGSVEAEYQEEVLSYDIDFYSEQTNDLIQDEAEEDEDVMNGVVENPNTNAGLPIIVVGVCIALFVAVVLINKKRAFLK